MLDQIRIRNMNKKWSLIIITLCFQHKLLSMEGNTFWAAWDSEKAASSATAVLTGDQIDTLQKKVAVLEAAAKQKDVKILQLTTNNKTLSDERDTSQDDYARLDQAYQEAQFRTGQQEPATTENLINSSQGNDLDDAQCFKLIQALLKKRREALGSIGEAHQAIARQKKTPAQETKDTSASTDVPTSNDGKPGKKGRKRICANPFATITSHLKRTSDTSKLIGTFQQTIQRWTIEIHAINQALQTLHTNYPILLNDKLIQIIFSSD